MLKVNWTMNFNIQIGSLEYGSTIELDGPIILIKEGSTIKLKNKLYCYIKEWLSARMHQ